MNKQELSNLIRNKLSLPRILLEMQSKESPEHRKAIEDIDLLIKEIDDNEITNEGAEVL